MIMDIIPKKYNPILQWIKNYSKKFLPLKGRWIQKRQFLKTEGFSSRSMVYCSTMG